VVVRLHLPATIELLQQLHDDVPADGVDPDDDLGWYATQEIPGLLR
jgi:hypothetical protein